MDYLEERKISYDIGLCQINNWWLKKLNIKNHELLNPKKNIFVAAKIYNENVKICKGNIYCALSMYNTGKKKSIIGNKYAKRVIKIRNKIKKEVEK